MNNPLWFKSRKEQQALIIPAPMGGVDSMWIYEVDGIEWCAVLKRMTIVFEAEVDDEETLQDIMEDAGGWELEVMSIGPAGYFNYTFWREELVKDSDDVGRLITGLDWENEMKQDLHMRRHKLNVV